MQQNQTDIIISGAGVAGLSLAIVLAKAGLTVAIIDPANEAALSNDAPSGRTVALMNSSLNILKATGAWPAIEGRSAALKVMRIIDISRPQKDPVKEAFEASELSLSQYGYNIPNAALRAKLYTIAKGENNITFYLERKLTQKIPSPSRGRVRVGVVQITDTLPPTPSLKGGEDLVLEGRLLVGADGRNSKVREIAGIDVTKKPYNQHAITFIINHSQSHNHTSTEFHRPAGPLALVPLPGNQSSVVWVNTPQRADELMNLSKQDFVAALESEIGDILGGITLETAPERWPLCAIKSKDLIAERIALIAEAAHVMSPITAQGLNLSLRDVAALAETVIDAARLGQDIGNGITLRSYAKRRRIDIETRSFGVDHMNRVVSNDIEAIKGLRHAGLKTLGYLPPIKRFAMRVGLAPAIDEGRLAKGEKL